MSLNPKDFELNRRITALGVQLERVQQTLADLAGEIERLKACRDGTPFESDAELVRLLIVKNHRAVTSHKAERTGSWHECIIRLDAEHVAELYYDEEARRLMFDDESDIPAEREGMATAPEPAPQPRDSDGKSNGNP